LKPYEFIGYALNSTTAITVLVGASTESRITFGDRAQSKLLATLPAINYFDLPGGTRQNGIISKTYQVNCRAATIEGARQLAELVIDVFSGSSGTGMFGTLDDFDARTFVLRDNGALVEPQSDSYNASIDVLMTCPVDTVN